MLGRMSGVGAPFLSPVSLCPCRPEPVLQVPLFYGQDLKLIQQPPVLRSWPRDCSPKGTLRQAK